VKLSVHAVFDDIKRNDESFRLMISVAAKGEHQGGWENERISALTRDETLRPKIARHGLDEEKHGRLFESLLKKRGLAPLGVPEDIDYTMLLETQGIGLSHERLKRDEPLSDEEILRYLIHSRVTEQRAAEEVELQRTVFQNDPELAKAIEVIADDEVNHLSFCHEELLRFEAGGHGALIHRLLGEYARVEVDTYRRVSKGIVWRMSEILGWSRLQRRVMLLGIDAVWAWERIYGWRRMVDLFPPERPDALGEASWQGPSSRVGA